MVDGGILNPVSIAPAFNDDTDLTIAVNLGGALQSNNVEVKGNTGKNKEASAFKQSINNFIKSFEAK